MHKIKDFGKWMQVRDDSKDNGFTPKVRDDRGGNDFVKKGGDINRSVWDDSKGNNVTEEGFGMARRGYSIC